MIHHLKRIAQNNTPRWVVLTIDLLLTAFSFGIASLVADAFSYVNFTALDYIIPLFTVLSFRFFAFVSTKSYTGIIRYTSTQDAVRIFFAVAISTFLTLSLEGVYFIALGKHFLKPGVIIIDAFILITLLSGFRITFKQLYNQYAPSTISTVNKEVIIYGAGEAGIIAKRSFEQYTKYSRKVIAFIDDNPKLHGKSVEGIRIYPSNLNLELIITSRKSVELVIAINNLSPSRKKKIIETCLQYAIKVKTIPPVSAWINGEFSPQSVKSVRIQDLLEREPIELSITKIKKELKGEIILITGAAGSIGSEIARQCLTFKPKKLVLLDQGETPLYELDHEFNRAKNVEVVIANVCNTARIDKVFQHFKPAYVFHAAAYKHVPLMEDNPYEAINTNVFGTQNVANIAVKYKVKKFVFVSTDKAVNPTNIMGASKRIAEIYIQSLNSKLKLDSDNHTKFVTTRFGNVLGSNGSVIPLFRKQIENGGPLTVTHPEITRYFMTIPEACQLVLEAGVMGKGGEIYIFDMGESVKIVDLARKMIKLSGLKEDEDIEIKYTGLRPGEKLKEELLNDQENTIGTHNPKIMVAQVSEYNYIEVNELINDMYQERDNLKNSHLVRTMKAIVPEYISNNSIYEELDKKTIES
ncbi:MAG: polysaccharide biosynthesis protein [Bacteroidetes bacterium]|nr:polysaccharide biosynthesis protein [Bacteroidota bacterium]